MRITFLTFSAFSLPRPLSSKFLEERGKFARQSFVIYVSRVLLVPPIEQSRTRKGAFFLPPHHHHFFSRITPPFFFCVLKTPIWEPFLLPASYASSLSLLIAVILFSANILPAICRLFPMRCLREKKNVSQHVISHYRKLSSTYL